MANFLNTSVYLPLLEDFYNRCPELYSCGYPYGPFVPYTFPNYQSAKERLFYIGRDPLYWVDKKEFITAQNRGTLKDYLEEVKKHVSIETIHKWNSSPSSFWYFVSRLHINIRTGKFPSKLNDDKYFELLSDIGYGNLFSIELVETLKYEDSWVPETKQDKKIYNSITKKAYPLSSIKNILTAYKPDIIFILSWSDQCDEREYFEGLSFDTMDIYFERHKRALYYLNDYKTKVIWSTHPCRLKYMGISTNTMIEYLTDSYNLVKTIW